MIKTLDILQYFYCNTKNWDEKKLKIKSAIDWSLLYKKDSMNFETDRYENSKSYLREFTEIFSDEFNLFAQEFNISQIEFIDILCVIYNQWDYHIPHNHGSKGFSGILYLNYDETIHTSTHFLSPLMLHVEDTNKILKPNVQEGDMIIFPSNILHWNNVNKSMTPRTIVSFDILVGR